ncbi:MAG: Eco29kI family restriction endonuclease [Candidatus Puniceispirillaceae bacterium]
MEIERQVFNDDRLGEVINDALSFISRSDLYPLPLPSDFSGAGVYLLYYNGNHEVYGQIRGLKVNNQSMPIYVGKAVPPGWRQGRNSSQASKVLYSRIKEHTRSIEAGADLNLNDFNCKFIILRAKMSNLIGTLESELINQFRPIWNSCIDGFGNHDPGRGRAQQARSEWDTLHPGRYWADKLANNKLSTEDILQKGRRYFNAEG